MVVAFYKLANFERWLLMAPPPPLQLEKLLEPSYWVLEYAAKLQKQMGLILRYHMSF